MGKDSHGLAGGVHRHGRGRGVRGRDHLRGAEGAARGPAGGLNSVVAAAHARLLGPHHDGVAGGVDGGHRRVEAGLPSPSHRRERDRGVEEAVARLAGARDHGPVRQPTDALLGPGRDHVAARVGGHPRVCSSRSGRRSIKRSSTARPTTPRFTRPSIPHRPLQVWGDTRCAARTAPARRLPEGAAVGAHHGGRGHAPPRRGGSRFSAPTGW